MTCSAYRYLTNSLPYYSHYHKHHFLYLYLAFSSFSFSYFRNEWEKKKKKKNCPDSFGFFPLHIIYIFKPIWSLQAWFHVISVMLLLEDCLFWFNSWIMLVCIPVRETVVSSCFIASWLSPLCQTGRCHFSRIPLRMDL